MMEDPMGKLEEMAAKSKPLEMKLEWSDVQPVLELIDTVEEIEAMMTDPMGAVLEAIDSAEKVEVAATNRASLSEPAIVGGAAAREVATTKAEPPQRPPTNGRKTSSSKVAPYSSTGKGAIS